MSQKAGPEEVDDMRPESDFSKGVRAKHYDAYRAGTNVVFLEPDVAKAFADSASVNRILRLLLKLAREHVPSEGRPPKRSERTSGAKVKRGASRG